MLIDWFTVVAQIINFLVLVALLKHFLWGRLVAAIDNREKRVAGQLAEAEAKNQEAARQMEQVRAEREEFENQRAAMLVEARHQADEQRNAMVQQAREEIQKLEDGWHQDLKREQTAFLDEVRERAGAEMLAIIRRALADLASADLQHSAMQVFLQKLRTLDAAALRALAGGELAVLTCEELDEQSRREVRETLQGLLGPAIHVKFERTQSFAWGVELRGSGRRIGWNSDTYIETLEQSLKEALARRAEVVMG
jgi:F-type H+-transporting ATPase subunit b